MPNCPKHYQELVIGIDQSYKQTGIAIATKNGACPVLLDIKAFNLESYGLQWKRRKHLREILKNLIRLCINRADRVTVICERVRVHGGGDKFINLDAIKSGGALSALIVDSAALYGVPVYSIDTRAWKAAVIGTSKGIVNAYGVSPLKWPMVKYLIKHGYEKYILQEVTGKRSKGTFTRDGVKWEYNNDAADAAGIALSYYMAKSDRFKQEH